MPENLPQSGKAGPVNQPGNPQVQGIHPNGDQKSSQAPAIQTQAPADQTQAPGSQIYTLEKDTKEASPQKSAFSFLTDIIKKEETKKPAEAETSPQNQENVYTRLFGKASVSKEKPNSSPADKGAQPAPSPIFPGLKMPVPSQIGPKTVLRRRQAEEFKEEKRIKLLKAITLGLAIIVLLFTGYFGYQIYPDLHFFGDTLAKKLQRSNDTLLSQQTRLNEIRFRAIVQGLTHVNLLADVFLRNSEIIDSPRYATAVKMRAQSQLGETREALKNALKIIAENARAAFSFSLPGIVVEEGEPDFEARFAAKLRENIALKKQTADSSPAENRVLDNILWLLDKKSFRGYLKSIKADELDDEALKLVLNRFRDEGTDDISLIAQLKQKRARWTEILGYLDELTRKVDILYGKDLFEKIGGIQYGNYEFNADSGVLTVTGLVKTEDTKTFSLMASLVDTLEKSPYFKDVEMREFAKAKASQDESFSGSIRLTIKIQAAGEKDPRDEALQNTPLTQ